MNQITSLYSKIRKVVQRTPHKVAIEYGEEKITYIEIERASNQVANFLEARIENSKNIPVFMDRSPELVEAILGILKIGALFVPLDIKIPESRLAIMLEDVEPEWVISQSQWLGKLNKIVGEQKRKLNVLVMDSNNINEEEYENLHIEWLTTDISKEYQYPDEIVNKHCYIYFTTGSTGRPKAVLGRHRSLSHFIQWEIEEFGVDESFRVSQLIAPSFGPYKRDIFVPLCAGATLCIPKDSDIILNSRKLVNWIEENKISLIHIVPSLFKVISAEVDDEDYFNNLKYILFCGEALRGNDLRKFIGMYKSKVQLAVLYGQTESTLAKMVYYIKESDVNRITIPVGKPIWGVEVLLLDENLRKCQIGSLGEICIRSPYISSGYYKDKELTKKVFIKNPFNDDPRDIIYRTGDIAKMLPDGNIEIIGRKDYQVKIRGMKVQIKGIENKLLSHQKITDALVIDKDDDNGNKYLCAYIIYNEDVLISDLKEFLAQELPDYMIPSYFIKVDKFPLTPNGKIDRKELPQPELNKIRDTEYEAPTNDIEEKLVMIWKEILNIDEIGVNDSFFEIGGHSLKATILISKIHKFFNKEILLSDVFERKTIKELAKLLEETDDSNFIQIDKVDKEIYLSNCYPVSDAQKRLYISSQIDPESVSYNISQTVVMNGFLDKEKFYDAIKNLIYRHETLRTSFRFMEDKLIQEIHENVSLPISFIDISNKEVYKEDIKALYKEFIKPFKLSEAPLFRVQLIKESENKHILMFDIHHIVSDATSIDILFRDFAAIYGNEALPELRIQYKDFTMWQNRFLSSDLMENKERFWLEKFSGELPQLKLPTDFTRPAVQSFEGERVSIEVENTLALEVESFSKKYEMTLYMTMLATLNILLYKYTSQEDIIIGTAIAGREHSDLQNLIGMFVNTLPMRNNPRRDMTVEEFLLNLRQNALNAFENQSYQFNALVDKLNIDRKIGTNPLFNVMFTMNNIVTSLSEVDGLKFDMLDLRNNISKFDLTLNVKEIDNKMFLEFDYYTKIFKRETIQKMGQHFIEILKNILNAPKKKLSEIDMLSHEEKEQIIIQFNNTEKILNTDRGVHCLFEKQVCNTPEQLALISEGECLTYNELNKKSNKVAWFLKNQGITENQIVGIIAERSCEMIAGILGVLKAGAAYLPIDASYPKDRINYMLENSNVSILLTQDKLKEYINVECKQIISIEALLNDSCLKEINIDAQYDPDRLIYVLYTSGSTGMPKGAMVKSNAFTNLIQWYTEEFNINVDDKIMLMASTSFDLAQKNLYATLIKGGSLYVLPPNCYNYNTISNIIDKQEISIINCAPSMFYPLIDANKNEDFMKLRSLRKIFLGGEPINLKKLRDWTNSEKFNSEIVNTYGPTECTDISTAYTIKKEELNNLENVPIGKPISNVKVYILGNHDEILPIGIPGEICIEGYGVGLGYMNDEKLTNEKFIVNPNISKNKMYKTGDIGMWLPDGNILFIGRKDHQVKVRGLRIELSEIENQLLKHEVVKEAIVTDFEDENKEKHLVAYFEGSRDIDVNELKEFLLRSIPKYMLPNFFIQLDKFPLTPNGKIDRKMLPKPNINKVSCEEYKLPKNHVEEILVGVWKEVLKLDSISTNVNYFDNGINSLLLIQLLTMIDRNFPGKIKITDMYIYPTIEKLAEYIDMQQAETNEQIKIETISLPDEYFSTEGSGNENLVFEFALEGQAIEKIVDISKVEKIEVQKILLSMYIFLLSELSNQKEINIQTTTTGIKEINIVKVNLSEVEDYSHLFNLTDKMLRNEENSFKYSSIQKIIHQKLHGEIATLWNVLENDEVMFDSTSIFDLVFEIRLYHEKVLFKCKYNASRLQKDKVEDIVNNYLTLINLLISQYEDIDEVACNRGE